MLLIKFEKLKIFEGLFKCNGFSLPSILSDTEDPGSFEVAAVPNIFILVFKVMTYFQKNSLFKKNKNTKSKNIKAKKESIWNKIPSRNYNFDSLEKMLLGETEFSNFNLYK